jgi:hypothetical protein
MGVELGSGVAVHGTGCVVLEFGGNEFGPRFCPMVPAHAGHRARLQLLQSDTGAGAMGLAYPVVITYESGERDGFLSREGPIPSGAVPHELFAGLWVLALAQGGQSPRRQPRPPTRMLCNQPKGGTWPGWAAK